MVDIPFFRRNKKNAGNTKASAEKNSLADTPMPDHVAIIMDGNNRWAKRSSAVSGHSAGAEVIRKVLTVCQEQQIRALTLFAFSSENWLRPPNEVSELMSLLKRYLSNEIQALHKKGIQVRFVGRRDRLNDEIVRLMSEAEILTAGNSENTLVMAIDYGGRWDIVEAAKKLARAIQSGDREFASVDEEVFSSYTSLSDLPPPDLCIRTGGERRISNFLLWDFAYAELYFTEELWPDFNEQSFMKALEDFGARQRRYGKTGDQILIEQQNAARRRQS